MFTYKIVGLTVGLFLLLDFIWLGLLMPQFYFNELGDLARKTGNSLSPNWTAAAVVYILIPLGLMTFVYPAAAEMNYLNAFLWGALFGLVLYGVYDFTNLATLQGYSFQLALIDTLWGAFACGFTTLAVRYILL